MSGQECAELLYERGGGLRGLARDAEEAVSKGGARINVVLLHSRKDPAREVCEWTPDGGMRPGVSRRSGRAVLTLNGRGRDPIRIAVVRSGSQRDVYYALSDCAAADFGERFVSMLDDHVPTISRVHLSNEDMRSIVGAAAETCDVRVRLVSSRSRRADYGGFDTRTDRIDRPAEEFVGADGEEGREIRTVGLDCRPGGRASGGAAASRPKILTVTRDCRFTARRGTGVLFGAMLPRAADLAAGRAEKMSAVAKTAKRRNSKSLIMSFKARVFADRSKNRSHVDAIGSMPYTALVDYHRDPFIHISLVDYGDCSTYDIFVLADDKVGIMPVFSATDASMSRLVNHMMEKFGDAAIEKYGGDRSGQR